MKMTGNNPGLVSIFKGAWGSGDCPRIKRFLERAQLERCELGDQQLSANN